MISRTSDDAIVAESPLSLTSGGQPTDVCVDDTGSMLLFGADGTISRWTVGDPSPAWTIRAQRGSLVIHRADDVFAIADECAALHRLSTGERLSSTAYEVMSRTVVAPSLRRCVQARD